MYIISILRLHNYSELPILNCESYFPSAGWESHEDGKVIRVTLTYSVYYSFTKTHAFVDMDRNVPVAYAWL